MLLPWRRLPLLCGISFGDYMTFGLRRTIDDLFHEGGLGEKAKIYADDWVLWRGNDGSVSDGGGDSAGQGSAPQNGLAEGSLLIHLTQYIVIKFVLAAATQTLPIPFGVIVPVFGVGAAMGRLVGASIICRRCYNGDPRGLCGSWCRGIPAGVTHTVSVAVMQPLS